MDIATFSNIRVVARLSGKFQDSNATSFKTNNFVFQSKRILQPFQIFLIYHIHPSDFRTQKLKVSN